MTAEWPVLAVAACAVLLGVGFALLLDWWRIKQSVLRRRRGGLYGTDWGPR